MRAYFDSGDKLAGHRVWQVYDCFYSTGEEDQELFEYMISNGVKINFEEFMKMYFFMSKYL